MKIRKEFYIVFRAFLNIILNILPTLILLVLICFDVLIKIENSSLFLVAYALTIPTLYKMIIGQSRLKEFISFTTIILIIFIIAFNTLLYIKNMSPEYNWVPKIFIFCSIILSYINIRSEYSESTTKYMNDMDDIEFDSENIGGSQWKS